MNRVCHPRGRQGRFLYSLAKGVTLDVNNVTLYRVTGKNFDVTQRWL